MELLQFISCLPIELRIKYYTAIIKSGRVDDKLWNEIQNYIGANFKNVYNLEDNIKFILQNQDDANEKKQILNLIKLNNPELYKCIAFEITSIEDINKVDKNIVKPILDKYSTQEIMMSVKAVSPEIRNYVMELISDRNDVDSIVLSEGVPFAEIIAIQSRIIYDINTKLK